VALTHRSQPRHPAAAARSFCSVGLGGMKSAADPVESGLAVRSGLMSRRYTVMRGDEVAPVT
jgi:hypothetical protein